MVTIHSRMYAAALVTLLCAAGPAVAADRVNDAQRGRTSSSSDSASWDLALTGGFVANGLIDPKWALGTVTGQPTRVVVRTTDQESSVSLGLAMFAQVYHERYSWIAPLSFGLGIREDSRATLYFGSALRFGPHASFTGGIAIGSVSALPAGVVEGRPVADTNVLSNLVTRTTHSWFAGVTYTFASLR